jgi:carbon storage regulator
MSNIPGRLIIGRRVGESFKINDDVTVTILEVRGRLVHVSIVAPKEVVVHRQEVWERIQQEKRA